MKELRCTRCKLWKVVSCFHRARKTKRGWTSHCRTCFQAINGLKNRLSIERL